MPFPEDIAMMCTISMHVDTADVGSLVAAEPRNQTPRWSQQQAQSRLRASAANLQHTWTDRWAMATAKVTDFES